MTFLNMYKRVSLPSVAKSQSSWIFITINLMVGPKLGLLPSSPPSWRGFDLKSHVSTSSFALPTKGVRSITLKVTYTSYSSARSNWYALWFIFLRTWKGQSPRGLSLDFLWLGNLSFLRWSQTQPLKKLFLFSPYCYVLYISLFVYVFGL